YPPPPAPPPPSAHTPPPRQDPPPRPDLRRRIPSVCALPAPATPVPPPATDIPPYLSGGRYEAHEGRITGAGLHRRADPDLRDRARSEERRVGKEWMSRGVALH